MSADNKPLVSVIAVCYNHERFLEKTLDSILSQTYRDIELCIFDDCSKDGSVKTIERWRAGNDVNCDFVAHEKNVGICATLNEALGYVRGKYVQIIACDDILSHSKIEKQVRCLEKHSEFVLCCSNYRIIDEYDCVKEERYYPESYRFPTDPFRAILEGHQGLPIVIHSPTVLVRKSAIDCVGKYPENLLQEDLFMWLNLTLKGSVGFIQETLVDYRKLANSLSSTLADKKRVAYLNGHLDVINDLLSRADGEKKRLLIRAKIKRIEKLAITKMSMYDSDSDEIDAVVDESIKILSYDTHDESFFVENTIGKIILSAWRRGRKMKISERKYLKNVPTRYRMLMLYGLPYRLKLVQKIKNSVRFN